MKSICLSRKSIFYTGYSRCIYTYSLSLFLSRLSPGNISHLTFPKCLYVPEFYRPNGRPNGATEIKKKREGKRGRNKAKERNKNESTTILVSRFVGNAVDFIKHRGSCQPHRRPDKTSKRPNSQTTSHDGKKADGVGSANLKHYRPVCTQE